MRTSSGTIRQHCGPQAGSRARVCVLGLDINWQPLHSQTAQRNSDGMEPGNKGKPSVPVRPSAPRIGEEIREAKVFLRQAEKAANRTKVTVYRVSQYLELTSF